MHAGKIHAGRKALYAAAAALVLTLAAPPNVNANTSDPFGALLGTWQGSGELHMDDGARQEIACKAGYKPGARKSERGKKITMTLSCASKRYKVDLRSRLNHKDGALSGGWFEKTREVSGSGKGRIENGQIALRLKAVGFSAELAVAQEDCSQTVELTPSSGGVERVVVEMTKGSC